MKTTLLLLSTLFIGAAFGQNGADANKKALSNAIKSYAKLGDAYNADALKNLLHDQHRLVWYGGKDAPFIVDKNGYISKIASKEWGGDKRTVTIESVQSFDGINATVKAVLDGEKSQMRSIFSLIKVGEDWKIIGELVNATFK